MTTTSHKKKLPVAILVLLVAALACTGVSQALIAQRAEDDGTPRDVSGPCDEAEHANDPRCTGVTVPAARTTTPTTAASSTDMSGPCDEAEHANDPRCTGATALRAEDDGTPGDVSGPCDEAEHANDPRCTSGTTMDDDSSEPSDRSGPSHDDSDDSSGPSDRSGPSHDDSDNSSGPSDRSGPSHDDSDNSGPGGSGSDDSGHDG